MEMINLPAKFDVFQEHIHSVSWQTPGLSEFFPETCKLEKGG